jgi:hypothetical protein
MEHEYLDFIKILVHIFTSVLKDSKKSVATRFFDDRMAHEELQKMM